MSTENNETGGQPSDDANPPQELPNWAQDITPEILDKWEKTLVGLVSESGWRATVGLKPSQAEGDEREQLIRAMQTAIRHLRQRRIGSAVTSDSILMDGDQGMALLALLAARPAIRITGLTEFEPQKVPPWNNLKPKQPPLSDILPCVGRIDAPGLNPAGYAGTGFLVGKGIALTNRHVADLIVTKRADDSWTKKTSRDAFLDFSPKGGADANSPTAYRVEEVLGKHPLHDLALLSIASVALDGKTPLPAPVTLAGEGAVMARGRSVAVIGYPARAAGNPEAKIMDTLFADLYEVKRLQPGTILEVFTEGESKGILSHDCSTLGGNSGSCVMDLESGDVIGLHYGGYHGRFNLAVALWMLRRDSFLSPFALNWAE